jgi:hypothetical protein
MTWTGRGPIKAWCPHIEKKFNANTTDEGISAWLRTIDGAKVKTVNLSGCEKVTDVGVSALAQGCSGLQHIFLFGCWKVTDVGVSALAQGCSGLQDIDLRYCNQVTDVGASALAQGHSVLWAAGLVC